MTGDAIKDRILAYIGKEKTNYAMMISGDWGTGKTYLLYNEIMPAISQTPIPNSDNNKYRPVYVSLSGISTIERLNELMFTSINLTPLKIKTKLDEDIAQFKNQPSFSDFKPKSEIPLNIIYCFDDLERVHPPFIEELLGYINTYIEHTGNKVLFICDETKIKKYFEERSDSRLREFGTIKEKYIRRTYRLDADLNVILNHQGLSEDNRYLIKNTFSAGRWNNLRTLQFALESLDEILEVFNTIKDIAKYEKKLEELIVFYTTFVSIEYKKGESYNFIQEIDFPNRVLSLEAQGLEVDLGFESVMSSQPEETEEQKRKKEERIKKKQEIIDLYFPPPLDEKEILFSNFYYPKREPFDSIGEFIDSGEFNTSKFKTEIEKIVASLIRQEGTEDEKIRNKINSIYDVPDSEARVIIEDVLESLKRTSYTESTTYLSLFSDLLILESHKIHNLRVDKAIVKIFTDSIKKSFSRKKLIRESSLHEKTAGLWSIDSVQAEKFHDFKNYVLEINDKLDSEADQDSSVETIINAIGGTDEDLEKTVVESKENYTLKNIDALPIFGKLTNSIPRAIDKFIMALDKRYILSGGHTQASYERGFINEMLKLVDKHLNSSEKDRPVSYITFYNLKKKIEYWIKYYSLNRE